MDYAKLNGEQVQPNTCGLQALENLELAFWYSRQAAMVGPAAPPLQLTHLPTLAQEVRAAFGQVRA